MWFVHQALFLSVLSISTLLVVSTKTPTVVVEFYGESQCPFCRQFVNDIWPEVWNDAKLMAYVEFDFVAWGNAYFETSKCGGAPYNSEVRACWYKECIVSSADNEQECFGGKAVYQHTEKEGEVDIYENCVRLHASLEDAVDFLFCCEGPNMDISSLSSQDLAKQCLPKSMDLTTIDKCFHELGHEVEVLAAKQTPEHPGVPYVVVDGKALDNPFDVKNEICDRLHTLNVALPSSCNSNTSDHVLGAIRQGLTM